MIDVPLPAGWGDAVLVPAPYRADPTESRAYDGRGFCLRWAREGSVACDLEHASARAPHVARRYGSRPLAPRWVVTETVAKLLDVPILVYLRDHGLEPAAPAAGEPWRVERGGRTLDLLYVRHRDWHCAFGRLSR